MVTVEVGKTTWIKEERGKPYEVYIAGETSRSWLVVSANKPDAWMREPFFWKLPKNGIKYSGENWTAITPAEATLTIWVLEHRYEIGSRVQGVQDINVLLQIARLVDMPNVPTLEPGEVTCTSTTTTTAT